MKKLNLSKQQILLIAGICLLIVIGVYWFPLGNPLHLFQHYHTDNLELDSCDGIKIVHQYLPYDSPRRPGEIREIRYITIHETDNRRKEADAKAHDTFLSTNNKDITGWHYTVDDHSIYHHIPDNEIAWNAGDGRQTPGGNINGIGIEMCVNLESDYEATLHHTAALVAALLKQYDLSVDDVYLHQHFMDKACPHRLLSEGRVYEFYKMITKEYEALK